MHEKSLTRTFTVDIVSAVDGKRYHGKFTTKKLTLGDIMEMGVKKAQLLSGFSYNPSTGKGISFFQDFLADMISICEVALIDRPAWFQKPEELLDHQVLRAVFEEVNSFENSFRADDTADDDRAGSPGLEGDDLVGRQGQVGRAPQSPLRQPDVDPTMVDQQVPTIAKIG